MNPTTPCSYLTAHKRLRRRRGPARLQLCISCGQQAEQWSYRGGSPLEQSGTTDLRKKGKIYTTHVTWSPDPADYDPLCVKCHFARDLTPERRQKLRERVKANPPVPPRINGAQVAILAMCGLRAPEIAKALDVSRCTVYVHRAKHMGAKP